MRVQLADIAKSYGAQVVLDAVSLTLGPRARIGLVPVHVPRDALSLTPCSARPLIAGSALFDGGVACAATPWPDGNSNADRASAATTAPLEVIDPPWSHRL